MNSKLIFSLALILGGYSHAAIIFPKAPDGGKQMAAKYLDPEVLKGLRIVNYEHLTIGDPVGSYSGGDVTSGKLLSRAKFYYWEYPMMDGTNAVGWVQLDSSNNWGATAASAFVNEMLEAARVAEKLPEVKKHDYELRSLSDVQVSFGAAWLHGQTNDIILPLPSTYGRMNAYQPYSESQIIAILEPEARRDAIMWAKLNKQEKHDTDAYAQAMTDYEKVQGGKCGSIIDYGMSSPIQNLSPQVEILTLVGMSAKCGKVGYRAKVTYERNFDNVQKVEILEKLTAEAVNKIP